MDQSSLLRLPKHSLYNATLEGVVADIYFTFFQKIMTVEFLITVSIHTPPSTVY